MNKEEEIQAGMIQQSLKDTMEVPEKQTLMKLIAEIQESANKVPADQTDALKAITMLIQVVNMYTAYTEGLKMEIVKLAKEVDVQKATIAKAFKKKSSILKPPGIV